MSGRLEAILFYDLDRALHNTILWLGEHIIFVAVGIMPGAWLGLSIMDSQWWLFCAPFCAGLIMREIIQDYRREQQEMWGKLARRDNFPI